MNLQGYFVFIVIGVLSIATILNAQEVKPPFDVNTVIEQVSKNHQSQISNPLISSFSRTGEFLIDTNVIYVPSALKEIGYQMADSR